MNIIKELILLAQEVDNLGLMKEADVLDKAAESLSKTSSDVEFDLLYQMMSYLVTEQNLSPEEALVRAAKELEDLTREGESFEPTDEEREKAKEYLPFQMMDMFPSDESIDN